MGHDAGSAGPQHEGASAGPQHTGGSAGPQESGGSAGPFSGRPQVLAAAPADLAPGLVAMAEIACAQVEAPIFAAAAEVWVHVQAATLLAADAASQEATQVATEMRPATGQISTATEGDRIVESGPDTAMGDQPGPGPAQTAPAQPQPQPQTAPEPAPASPNRPTRPASPTSPARATSPARLDDGPALDEAVLSMLACNAWLRRAVPGADDRITNLGRRLRSPSRRQYAALFVRDRGCAAPGCTRNRFLHSHHVLPWSCGGPTSLDNLILLCGDHHRALHRGQFHIKALGRERFHFLGPHGARYPAAPPVHGTRQDLSDRYTAIGPATIQPDWQRDPLDLDWAVGCYLQAAEPRTRAARPSETGTSETGLIPEV